MTKLSVSLATESEAPACLALLPKAAGTRAELLIARMDGEFCGAGAVFWANVRQPAGFHVLIKVFERARRRGVGRKLIEASAALAAEETDGLWSFDALPPEGAESKFLEACGFARHNNEFHYLVGVESLHRSIGSLIERMKARGHIPAGAECIPLSDPRAPLDEIAWLIAREFGNSPSMTMSNLRQRQSNPSDRSLFAARDGEAVGALLWRVQDDVATVDVRAVSRRSRNGWPNALMLDQALRQGLSEGIRDIRFFCDDAVADTISLARRGGGEEVDVKARYHLALGQE